MKKKLTILFAANIIDRSIVKFLENEFEVEVLDIGVERIKKPSEEDVSLLKTANLIVFTGGEDVDPEQYGESKGKYTYSNKKRDAEELEYLYPSSRENYFLTKLPKLGICRGAQFLTVYNGGSLIQHVEGHKNNKQVLETIEGMYYTIDSDHHQMMNPFNLNKDKYELIAWSKKFQSNKYLNGKNENIILPKNFLEAEIVYYKYSNSLCIQAHPEWCIGSTGSEYCIRLISKYLLQIQNNSKRLNEEYVDYSLPPGLNHIPSGWIRTGIDGKSYFFDGEYFRLTSSNNTSISNSLNILKNKYHTETLEEVIQDSNDSNGYSSYNYIDLLKSNN